MGRFNTYQSEQLYVPKTFEESSRLPMMLRERQDKMDELADTTTLNLNQTKVADAYQESFGKAKQILNDKTAELSARLAKSGSGDPTLIAEFRSMKRSYNDLASETGAGGAGTKERELMEAERLKYVAFGASVHQNQDAVKARWDEQQAKRTAEVKAGLVDNPRFVAQAPNIEQAPEYKDVSNEIKELASLVGKIGEESMTSGTTVDANGMLTITKTGENDVSNLPNLVSFVNYMNNVINNKDSKLRKSMNYNRVNIEDVLKEASLLTDTMKTKLHTKTSETDLKFPGGSGNGKNADDKEVKEDASIIATNQVGQAIKPTVPGYNNNEEFELNSTNASRILADFNAMEQRNDPRSGTIEFSAAKSQAIQLAIQEEQYARSHPNYKANAFGKMMKAGMTDYNIGYMVSVENGKTNLRENSRALTSYDDFNKRVKNTRAFLQQKINQGVKEIHYQGSATTPQSLLAKLSRQESEINSDLQEHYESDSKELYAVNNYTFSSNKASEDMKAGLNSWLKGNMTNLIPEAKSTGASVYSIGEEGIGVVGNSIEELSVLGTPASVNLESITSKGVNGFPGMRLSMVFGSGEKQFTRYMDMNFDDSEGKANLSREIFRRITNESKDPETVAVVNSILENARSMKIIPDSVRDAGKGWTKIQNQQIIDAANSSGLKNQTVNGSGNHKYQVLQDESGYYGVNIAKKNENVFNLYNVQNFINDATANTYDPVIKDNLYVSKVDQLILFMKENESNPADPFGQGVMRPTTSGDSRAKMLAAIKEYKSQKHPGAKLTPEAELILAKKFVEQTSNIGILSRSRMMFISGKK